MNSCNCCQREFLNLFLFIPAFRPILEIVQVIDHSTQLQQLHITLTACPDPQDFRAAQCAVYNPIPYRGRLYEWLPYQDPEDPCSLTCHAKSYSFVAKLASSVKDGTRCREGSLDMCVQGNVW
ncbi:ADAMTS-like protein 3 [Trichonephila clavata]|uniref:ADAMTS-like protein 3 n=1 Tax=Trichonephila clavata TaxID=2740835 RepID=A0A8X6M6J9_TRICU|nr:ADAMTS-like protein 3 [Trichonephila clavata]